MRFVRLSADREEDARKLNDVIERVGVFPLKLADAIAKLGERDAVQDFDDRIAHLFHDTADTAELFVGAGAAFVKSFTDATNGCERAFDKANDAGKGDFIRRKFEAITAGNPAAALKNACGAQVVEDLFEETLGNVLLVGNGLDANDFLVGIEPEDNKARSPYSPRSHNFIREEHRRRAGWVKNGSDWRVR